MARTAIGAGARRSPALAEVALMLAVVAGFAHILWFFHQWRYLPQPFIWSIDDTFGDWFATAYWAHNPGAFDNWQTVYPPLSFVFLNIFTNGACYRVEGAEAYSRDCDVYGLTVLLAFYVLNVVLAYACYWKQDRRTAWLRGTAIAVGLPLLYTLERGNLILPCFSFFILAHSRLLRHAWMKWLSVAMTINFKPYLVLAVLPRAARGRWRWLEGAGIATVFVYLISYALMGAGDPAMMLQNIRHWADWIAPQYWWNFFDSTTWLTVVDIINSPVPLRMYLDSRLLDVAVFMIPLLIHLGQAGVAASMLCAWRRPSSASLQRLGALAFSLQLTATNPGGYTELFLVFLVFFERWRGLGAIIALTCAYLLCVPADHIVVGVFGRTQESWLGDREVATDFGVAVGQILRPGLVLAIQYALAGATIMDFVRAKQPALLPRSPGEGLAHAGA